MWASTRTIGYGRVESVHECVLLVILCYKLGSPLCLIVQSPYVLSPVLRTGHRPV